MKIGEYEQMMSYLTRPESTTPIEPRENFNAGGEAEYQRRLKIAQDKFGKDNLDAAAKTLGYKKYDDLRGEKFSNVRRKIFKELEEFGSALPEKESRSRSRVEKRIPKEQGIQIKLLETTNQNKFFDPKNFAKKNNISLKQVKEEAKKLQRNIYKKRIVEASRAIGKETKNKLDWIPNDSKFSDNTLNKLWKSKLIKYEREKIDELFFDAFGRKTSDKYNPKKFLAIKKNLNEYRQLRDAINAKFPNINFELDHPLSKSSLNKLFNATTEQLTRVNVLEADLNNGFKDSLSLQYEKAVQGNDLNKKKSVEKIAKDLKLNIGKISDDATNFKYGVKEFQKLNIKNEISKSLENLSALNKNFQTYAKKNPDLFKTAGVNPKQTFTQIKPSELKKIQNILKKRTGELGFINTDLLKDVGKFGKYALQVAGTPLGVVGLTAGLGVDPTSSIDRSALAAEAALAPALVKGTEAVTKNAALKKLLNLSMSPKMAMRAARIASPLGIASLGGEAVYQYGKFAKGEIEKLKNMEPDERKAYTEALMDEGGLLE